jgi:hypothetical protein
MFWSVCVPICQYTILHRDKSHFNIFWYFCFEGKHYCIILFLRFDNSFSWCLLVYAECTYVENIFAMSCQFPLPCFLYWVLYCSFSFAFNFSAGKLACRHMLLPISDCTVLAHCRKLRQRHSAKAWRKTWGLYQGNHCYLEDSTGHLSLLLCQLHIMFSILGSYRGHIL